MLGCLKTLKTHDGATYLGDLHTPVEQQLRADVVLVLMHVVQKAAVGHQLGDQLDGGTQAHPQQPHQVRVLHAGHDQGLLGQTETELRDALDGGCKNNIKYTFTVLFDYFYLAWTFITRILYSLYACFLSPAWVLVLCAPMFRSTREPDAAVVSLSRSLPLSVSPVPVISSFSSGCKLLQTSDSDAWRLLNTTAPMSLSGCCCRSQSERGRITERERKRERKKAKGSIKVKNKQNPFVCNQKLWTKNINSKIG